jgi:hypothetical protein
MRSRRSTVVVMTVATLMTTWTSTASADVRPSSTTVVRSPCNDNVHDATMLSGKYHMSVRGSVHKGRVVITNTQDITQKVHYTVRYASAPNEEIGKTVFANDQYPGTANWLYVNGTAHFDDEGDYTGATGKVTDICAVLGLYG